MDDEPDYNDDPFETADKLYVDQQDDEDYQQPLQVSEIERKSFNRTQNQTQSFK